MECIAKYSSTYIHGKTNVGKTTQVLRYLKDNDYEYQYTPLQYIRNESGFLDLLKNRNIYNMMKHTHFYRAIVIDNIDYLQNNDKKVLGYITKYMKEFKKLQNKNGLKFIFIGINMHDKKVIELEEHVEHIIEIEAKKEDFIYDKNVKETCFGLLTKKNMDYATLCDKTIISLLFHENIINFINNDIIFYQQFLNNFAIGDYYDRVSFQRQLWQFNEMTFFLKVVNSFIIYHKKIYTNKSQDEKDIIFTKILTKYSNEYSNMNFIISICIKMNLQKLELSEYLRQDINQEDNVLTQSERNRACKLLL